MSTKPPESASSSGSSPEDPSRNPVVEPKADFTATTFPSAEPLSSPVRPPSRDVLLIDSPQRWARNPADLFGAVLAIIGGVLAGI